MGAKRTGQEYLLPSEIGTIKRLAKGNLAEFYAKNIRCVSRSHFYLLVSGGFSTEKTLGELREDLRPLEIAEIRDDHLVVNDRLIEWFEKNRQLIDGDYRIPAKEYEEKKTELKKMLLGKASN
jgi:hypothetical protein